MIRTDLDLINVKKRVHGETTTLYWRLGNPVIRKRRNRNVSGKKWKHTPKRVEAINKFTTGRRLTAAFLLVLGEVSPWRRAARLSGANGQTGENFFFSRNHGYLSADGKIADFPHFRLSLGRLLSSPGIRLSREGYTVTLEWDATGEQPLASPDDLLHVGIIYDPEPDCLELADTSGTRRKDGKLVLTLDPARGTRVHLYPFFGREDNSDFSDNDYFTCEITPSSLPGKPNSDDTRQKVQNIPEKRVRIGGAENIQKSNIRKKVIKKGLLLPISPVSSPAANYEYRPRNNPPDPYRTISGHRRALLSRNTPRTRAG